MTCIHGRQVGNKIACRHKKICGRKRYTFVAASRCTSCEFFSETPDAITLPQVDDCVHRTGHVAVEAKCGCKGVKTLDLYQCGLYGDCAADETTWERLKETRRKQQNDKAVRNCATCPSQWTSELDRTENVYVHFNPARYQRSVANLSQWWDSLGSLQRITRGVHLVFDEAEPVLPNATRIQATAGQAYFIKEALINHAVRTSSAEFIAWVDADLIYPSHKWLLQALRLMDQYDAIQLFQQIERLTPQGPEQALTVGQAMNWLTKQSRNGAPGGAWLMRREKLLELGGLPEFAIVGGGDAFAFDAWTGQEQSVNWEDVSKPVREMWQAYGERCAGMRVGYLPEKCKHLYHGTLANRRYERRQQLLSDFNPARDMQMASNGLPEIVNPQLLKSIKEYMLSRMEDDE